MSFRDYIFRQLAKALAMSAEEAKQRMELENALMNCQVIMGKELCNELLIRMEIEVCFNIPAKMEYVTERIKIECDYFCKHAKPSWH